MPPGSRSFVEFPTTNWTLILQAQGAASDESLRLLNELLRRYWKPVYAYFRAQGRNQTEAEELVQEFLHRFVRGDKIQKVERRNAKFRSWLRVCARNFLRDVNRRRKARSAVASVSFRDLEHSDGRPYEPAGEDPDEAFAESWRRELLEHAMERVAARCRAQDRSRDFDIFCAYYCAAEGERVIWKDVASRFGLSDAKTASHKADWVKDQLQRAIREEVRSYVDSESEVDEELRRLL